MRIAFWPRDENPYQKRLSSALAAGSGIKVSYLGELTGSHTLNVLLLPFELVLAKLRGIDLVHFHWLYRFSLPIPAGKRLTRRLCRSWLGVVLRFASITRLPVVWTAHNVLPHSQIFDDDIQARIRLLKSCAGVIVHSTETSAELTRRGWPLPALTATIPPAPLIDPPVIAQATARTKLQLPAGGCIVGMLGRIDRYKRPADLISAAAAAAVPATGLTLVIAGRCHDRELADELQLLARTAGLPVHLDLRELTDDEFDMYLAALDAFVVPFQRATTSGSVATALAAGLEVLVPANIQLGEIPAELITHYRDLAAELARVANRSSHETAVHRENAIHWTRSRSWDEVAEETARLYRQIAGVPAATHTIS